MSFLQRAKTMLGFVDDDYDDDEYEDDYYDEEEEKDEGGHSSHSVYHSPYLGDLRSVHRVDRGSDVERVRHVASPQIRMHIIEPRSFSEAQGIADRFKMDVPVIMNLTIADPGLAKRLIDFTSGLTYGLEGGLQKVSERVFMLTPANVDVSDSQRCDLRDKGLFTIDS